MDTENKELWYKKSLHWEKYFCDNIANMFGIEAIINPEKIRNPMAIDLIIKSQKGDILTELKPQFTPFFKSKELYGIDSQFAFAFNVRDYYEYKNFNSNIWILFWLFWLENKMDINKKEYKVSSICGLWTCSIKMLNNFIINKKPDIHIYKKRINDNNGNAKNSYIFDIRNFINIPFQKSLFDYEMY
jgi:hypothetical protein